MNLIFVETLRRIAAVDCLVAGIWLVARPGDAPLGPHFADASILDA